MLGLPANGEGSADGWWPTNAVIPILLATNVNATMYDAIADGQGPASSPPYRLIRGVRLCRCLQQPDQQALQLGLGWQAAGLATALLAARGAGRAATAQACKGGAAVAG